MFFLVTSSSIGHFEALFTSLTSVKSPLFSSPGHSRRNAWRCSSGRASDELRLGPGNADPHRRQQPPGDGHLRCGFYVVTRVQEPGIRFLFVSRLQRRILCLPKSTVAVGTDLSQSFKNLSSIEFVAVRSGGGRYYRSKSGRGRGPTAGGCGGLAMGWKKPSRGGRVNSVHRGDQARPFSFQRGGE